MGHGGASQQRLDRRRVPDDRGVYEVGSPSLARASSHSLQPPAGIDALHVFGRESAVGGIIHGKTKTSRPKGKAWAYGLPKLDRRLETRNWTIRLLTRISIALVLLAVLPLTSDAKTVVAHAGGSTHGPENTIPTIQQSIALGSDWIELDVRLTADFEAVLMHDPTVDRTTDGTGLLSSLTLAQVLTLDAGSWFAPEFAGTPVPTLVEALDEIKGNGKILIDMKDSLIGPQIAASITASGFSETDVVLWVNSPTEVTEGQTFVPDAAIFWQFTSVTPTQIQIVTNLGVDGISVLLTQLTQEVVDLAHAEGLQVFAWPVFTPEQMRKVLGYGVDGLHATNPEVVLTWLAEVACRDGIDNDGDGLTDFPDDPGCGGVEDNSELAPPGVPGLSPLGLMILVVVLLLCTPLWIRQSERNRHRMGPVG